MHDLPRQKLIEIVADRTAMIARTGRDVTTDVRLCEALLRDLCGEYRREISVLVAAQKERVATDLLAPQHGIPREVLLTHLTQRLQDNLGLTEEAARWAVDSWALALGLKLPQPAAFVASAKPAPAVVNAPPSFRPPAPGPTPSPQLTPQPQPRPGTATPLPRPHTRGAPWGWIVGIFAVMAVLIFALTQNAVTPAPTPTPRIAEPVPVQAIITKIPTTVSPTAVPPAAPPTLPPATATGIDSMIYVPPGEFEMGAATSDTRAGSDEQPAHTVYLDGFYIDRTEVTNAMFKNFIDATHYQTDAEKQGNGLVFDTAKKTWSDMPGANWQHPHGPDSNLTGLDDHPVVQVSWNDATAYCQWAGGNLPTEAQWEKAARGIDGRLYPWGNQAPADNLLNSADRSLEIAWADKSIDDNYQFTAPVGYYPDGASPYGALDMAGNVWEWVRDWYDDKYYASSPARNPENTTRSDERMLRGGSWNNDAANLRASIRLRSIPVKRDEAFGFRCAR